MATTLTLSQQMSVSDVYRRLIPNKQGESIREQIYPWNLDGIREDMQKPLPIHEGDPETMLNVISMLAVEMQHWFDYHAYSKMTTDSDAKSLFGALARAEHMHTLKLMSLIPKPHHPAEAVLAAETAVMMGYCMAMQQEPNDSIKSAFNHILGDHLTHAQYAADQVSKMGCDPAKITGGCDMSGGRPLEQQWMRPDDTIWEHNFNGTYRRESVQPQTLINVDMALAGEVDAWNGYICSTKHTEDQDMRTHFAAFASIEDQHVSILGSIKDPTETILERSLVHENVEIVNYQRLMDAEPNDQVKKVFQDLYREDLEQGRVLGRMAG